MVNICHFLICMTTVFMGAAVYSSELDLYAMEDLEAKKIAVFDADKIFFVGQYSKIRKEMSFVMKSDDVKNVFISLDNINGNTVFNVRKTLFGVSLCVGSNGNLTPPAKVPYILGKDKRIPGNYFLKTKIADMDKLPNSLEEMSKIDVEYFRKISLLNIDDLDNSRPKITMPP